MAYYCVLESCKIIKKRDSSFRKFKYTLNMLYLTSKIKINVKSLSQSGIGRNLDNVKKEQP